MSTGRFITDELVAALLQSVPEFRADIEKSLQFIADAKRKILAAERLLEMAEAEGANVGDLSD